MDFRIVCFRGVRRQGLTVLVGIVSLLGWVSCGSQAQDGGPGKWRGPAEDVSPETASQEDAEGLVIKLVDGVGLVANTYQSVRFQVLGSRGRVFERVSVVNVKPWMSVHGHGSAKPQWRPAEVSRDDFSFDGGVRPGRDWVLDELFFVMSGPWELQFTVEWDGGPSQTIILPLEVR